MDPYVEKLVEDCFKGIKAGLHDSDRRKVWRAYFKLKDVLSVVSAKDINDNDEVVVD